MSNQEIKNFLSQYPHIETIELLVPDLNGVFRGKRIERDLLEKIYETGFCLPASVMSLSSQGETVEEAGLGLAQGDRDYMCRPVPNTLSIVPWIPGETRAQVLCTMYNDQGELLNIVPRNILTIAEQRFQQLGYTVGIALELEFYLIDTQRTHESAIQPPISKLTGQRMTATQTYAMDDLADYDDFIQAVISAARKQNIPADSVIAEYAPGQFEVNLNYGNDILAAADQALLLKRVICAVAKQQGMQATFMAKPYLNESGSGLHMHLSLFDESGQNIFADQDPTKNRAMQNAMGGLLDIVDGCQALWSPTINSFKRLAPGSFAPTSKTWGYDNRSVALRIPSGNRKATRIEHRMAGADANPYLATAALLAGIYHGLTQKIQPPAPVIGDAYQQDHPRVADNQRDALRHMYSDQRVIQWFGKPFVELFHTVKWADIYLFEQQISQMEYDLLMPYV